MSATCSRCKSDIVPGDTFCTTCGTPVPKESLPTPLPISPTLTPVATDRNRPIWWISGAIATLAILGLFVRVSGYHPASPSVRRNSLVANTVGSGSEPSSVANASTLLSPLHPYPALLGHTVSMPSIGSSYRMEKPVAAPRRSVANEESGAEEAVVPQAVVPPQATVQESVPTPEAEVSRPAQTEQAEPGREPTETETPTQERDPSQPPQEQEREQPAPSGNGE